MCMASTVDRPQYFQGVFLSRGQRGRALNIHAFVQAIDSQRIDTNSRSHVPELDGAIVTATKIS